MLRRSLALLLICASTILASHPVRERRAMVVAQEPLATDVGVEVLRKGGNAIDAAVAVAFALAVTHPVAGNLGGGGFLLVRKADGTTNFLDFRERAPKKATRGMYLDDQGNATRDSVEGWRAAGVPGTVHGLEAAHRKYGSKPWAELVAPAVRLAGGFTVSYALAESVRSSAKLLAKFPESDRIFLRNGKYFEAGETFVQPELARTLERIAKHGAKDFYQGETARKLAAAMAANGGALTLEDLKDFRTAERQPLTGTYQGHQIITAPPPSSGGIGILQMMGMLEGTGYERSGAGSAAAIHFVAEAMRRFYADRSEFMADPDYYKVPISRLLDPKYLARQRATIQLDRASTSDQIRPGKEMGESAETTHLSIVDPQGNAAALTYTINDEYGCGVTVPGLGFLLNNEMDDFTAKPGVPNLFGLVQGEANAIQPGKRPLSSMTPTILLKDGKLFMVLGAPGGSRIINGVLQVILNVIDFRMNAQDAIDAPRFHHQWQPDKLMLERGFSPDTVALLQGKGHTIDSIANVARVEAIVREGDWWQGGTDRRAHGKAAGF